jgi:transcriptional regulator with XRE-family HTH domain
VGTRLREAREARGWSIRQIADATKLSARVLLALEEQRVEDLPPGIYRRAAVRTYARELGLDVESTLLAYLREHPDHLPMPGTAMATLIGSSTPSRLPRLFGWLGAVVPAVAAVAYLVLAFGLPGERRLEGQAHVTLTEPTAPILAQRVAYVTPGPIVVTITATAPTQVTVVTDGEVSANRVIAPATAVDVSFHETVEIRADDGSRVHVGAQGATGRMIGTAMGPQTLTLSRATYVDELRRR